MKTAAFLATFLACTLMSSCSRKEESPPAASNSSTHSNAAPAVVSKAPFEKLKGRWLRPDGGYVIEVRDVSPEGKMEMSYFNPRSINVAKAEALQHGSLIKVMIELRDVNYPGSTYTLAYDPNSDRMSGNYFQAALGQNFDVEFIRQP